MGNLFNCFKQLIAYRLAIYTRFDRSQQENLQDKLPNPIEMLDIAGQRFKEKTLVSYKIICLVQ